MTAMTGHATSAPNPPAEARRPVRPLVATLHGEWIKATTVRTLRALLAAAAVVGLLTSWATANFVDDDSLRPSDVVVSPILLTAVLAAIAGVLLFTTEVQHGTLAGALTAHPTRWPVVWAKVTVAAVGGLALGLVGVTTGAVGGLIGGADVTATTGLLTTALWALLYTTGSSLLGLGVGMAVRHSAGAVSGLLVWWLVVEAVLVQFAPPGLVRFVPFDTGFRTLGIRSEFDVPEVVAAGLPHPAHAAIFWGWVVAVLGIGVVLVGRRDVD